MDLKKLAVLLGVSLAVLAVIYRTGLANRLAGAPATTPQGG